MSLNSYPVHIRLTLVWTDFFLVLCVEAWKLFLCSTCVLLVDVLDMECTGFGRDGVDFFIADHTVLCFRFVTKTVLITHKCYSCC